MFGVCMSVADTENDTKLLPKPPPPPPRRSSNEGSWFPGKLLSQLGTAAREKIDELPSLSTHGFSSHGRTKSNESRRASAQEVALLFPNTTRAIARERELRENVNNKEWDKIEKWWVSQLLAEAAMDDDELKNLLAKGKSPKALPIPSDSRWAFEARIMHPSCSGTLRIILHFVTEFLSNDVVNVVSGGGLGQWTLPTLIHAFIRQIENILSSHPLWRSEFANYTPNDEEGKPLTPIQEQELRAQDAAWESSCDELENFIFRKIGTVLLPAKGGTMESNLNNGKGAEVNPPVPPLGRPSWSTGYGHGGTGSRAEKSLVVYERLNSLKWISSEDLGVSWSSTPDMWMAAGKELNALASCQAPLEMIHCLVKCFAHVSSVLVELLEKSKAKDKKIREASNSKAKPVSIRQALLSSGATSFNEIQQQQQEYQRTSIELSSFTLPTDDDQDDQDEDLMGNNRVSFAASSRWSLESKDVGSNSKNLPCADDVLPAVILVLLQSNPRHILAYLDFALAFRNQQRLSSEGQYFIVTLTSAVHFLLDIEPDQLGLTEEEFERRAMESCKNDSNISEYSVSCDNDMAGEDTTLFTIDGIVEEGSAHGSDTSQNNQLNAKIDGIVEEGSAHGSDTSQNNQLNAKIDGIVEEGSAHGNGM